MLDAGTVPPVAREMTWVYNGRGYTTGAAGSRCYDDLVAQRGVAVADRIRDESIAAMNLVRSMFRDGRGQEKFDVTVEGFLIAAGVPREEVAVLARRYRAGTTSSVDLSGYE